MAAYAKVEYWNKRYENDPEPIDFYQKWAQLKNILMSSGLKKNHRILHIGCGNSELPKEMIDDGFETITNIDFSDVVISAMQKKYSDQPKLSYKVMDCLDMSEFQNESFDCVLDKGTLDSILCGDFSEEKIKKMLSEISRVLKNEGLYICVSHGLPKYRTCFLQNDAYSWILTTKSIDRPSFYDQLAIPFDEVDRVHYIYFCQKKKSIEQ